MKIFNSLTQKLEEFKPLDNKKVTIYVCGITPYDTTHLGHAFTYISFDVLVRYLKFKGYQVIYSQNVTDINDRDNDILERAKELNVPWRKLANYWTKKFLEDMNALNWTPPSYYVKASETIPQIIDLIKNLINKDLAYQVDRSVYLDISKFPNYDKLSKLSPNEMLKVASEFEEDLKNPDKSNPLDITLWRGQAPNQPLHIPSFPSPFGLGRPGWHIECSAISISTLGEQIDIHGGGRDLIFPHHEAEMIQSEGATGKIPFVRYWVHGGIVFFKREKMSKSKGNLVMVSDLLKKYSANALRWLLLSHHFRKDWEYQEKDLIEAQKCVDTVETLFLHLKEAATDIDDKTIAEFIKIMDQDLDTPKALEFLLKLAKETSGHKLKTLFSLLGFKTQQKYWK